jgi:DNA-binding PadR family transcriptional regulator
MSDGSHAGESRTDTDASSADKRRAVVADDLSRFQIDLLAALATEGPSVGLTLKSTLSQRYAAEVNNGRLYRNLDRLADRGLIVKRRGQPDGRSNSYALTERGRKTLRARREWLAGGVDTGEGAATDGGIVDTWETQVDEPAPLEAVRELEQKPGVRAADSRSDCRGRYVEVTLAERVDALPARVARPLYRRGFAVADVSPVAGRSHLRVIARPDGGGAT